MQRIFLAVLAASVLTLASWPTRAPAAAFKPDFRNLTIGLTAAEMPTESFDAFACGSNGGPPLAEIKGWTDYAKCPPDADGLHEVAVAFGTELATMANRVRDQYRTEPWFAKFAGTRVAGFQVVMSMLFDDSGVARAFRVVTDQGAPGDERARAYLMETRVKGHYGLSGWNCKDRPPADGQSPVGHVFINRLCTKVIGPKLVTVESHLFRKRGQTGYDDNYNPVAGQFESLTIWESWDKAFHDRLAKAGAKGGDANAAPTR